MEISVKDFSGTTSPRILKLGTKLSNEQLYCVINNQPHIAYQSLYLSIFLSENKTKVLRFIFAFFFYFPSFYLSLLCNEY